MDALDPFYNAEEEAKAKEQASANRRTRKLLSSREVTPIAEPVQPSAFEFIEFNNSGDVSSASDQPKSVPWMPSSGYPPYSNLFLRLHQEVIDFERFVSLNDFEEQARKSFLHKLNGVCKALWPRSKVVPFGSYYTGLSLPSSDIDVSVIDVPIEDYGLAEVGCLRKLANALLEQQQVSFIELRETAKIPILRIRDRSPPYCEIDININIDSPQATSKFVLRNAIEVYPAFRPLVMLIKCFLYQRNLADTFTGGIGSYLLSIMVLAFFQQHQLSDQPRLNELTSLGHLLFDFFNFYARDFRTDREGLSVLRGGCRFSKSSRGFTSNLMNRRSLSTSESLCVESPLEPQIDIGNKVFQWKIIRMSFMQARQYLIDSVQTYDPDNNMESYISPILVNHTHLMFDRSISEEIIDCPLRATDLVFQTRSESIPPSPYSEHEIVLEASDNEVVEDISSGGSADDHRKRRRYSDDRGHQRGRDQYRQDYHHRRAYSHHQRHRYH
jgi:DNA polymerase sigma